MTLRKGGIGGMRCGGRARSRNTAVVGEFDNHNISQLTCRALCSRTWDILGAHPPAGTRRVGVGGRETKGKGWSDPFGSVL